MGAEAIEVLLERGEQVVATRKIATKGRLGGSLAAGFVGGLPVAAANSDWRALGPDPVGLLVVTTNRLLIVGTTLFGRPKRVVAAAPLYDVTGIDAEKAKIAFGKLRVTLRDGMSEFDLKSDRGLEEFLDLARSAIERSRG